MRRYGKKLLSLALALVLVVALLPALTQTAQAYNTGDDYPSEYKNSDYWWCYNHAENRDAWDEWYFIRRQCTSFVAHCLNTRNGIPFNNSYRNVRWGDARNWGNAARSRDIDVDDTPAVGAVAWWDNGSYGHVGWVSAVNGDQATTEEYNWHNDGAFHTATFSRYGYSDAYKRYPPKYIHIADLSSNAPPQPTVTPLNLGNDFYATIFYVKGGKLLEAVDSGRSAYPVNVQLNDQYYASVDSTDPRCIWHFTRHGDDGSYRIINEYYGYCLDVESGIAASEQNVGAWHDDWGGNPERWFICEAWGSDRWYSLLSALELPSFALDVYRVSEAPGTNVQICDRVEGNAAQQFNIVKKDNYRKPAKPATPRITRMSAGDNSVSFAWTDSPTADYDIRQYAVRLTDPSGKTLVNTTQYGTSYTYSSRSALAPGTYKAEVQAINIRYLDHKSGWTSATATVSAPEMPSADSDFTIENGVLTKYNGPGGDVTIPDGVTSVGEKAFAACLGLTSVIIPDSVTSIGDCAFLNSGLADVTIPDSVTYIGESAFSGCWHLTSITIPSGVTSIEDDVFWSCKALTNVTIPNSVTEIGVWAFYDCTSLTSVTIPSSVTSIESSAFTSCTNLTDIRVNAGSDNYTDVNGVLFADGGKTLHTYPGGKLGFYSIPNGVTNIGWHAFSNCTGLTSVIIPNSIASIGGVAFDGCTGLTSIIIPDSVTNIGEAAFRGCTGLTSVTIPDSVTGIDHGAFEGCTALKDVYYGGSEAQWKAIGIGGRNESLTNATIHYSGTSTATPDKPTTPPATSQTANPTNDKLAVDGKDATPAAYKISSANYFKLRDLAMMMNGTKGQFSVDYADGKITIVTGQPYTPIGGELGDPPTQGAGADPSNDTVYINGEQVELAAYKIGGANYYGLRDLARRLGFNVGWAPGRGMYIESDKPYTDAD